MTVGTGVNPNSDEESYQRLAKGLYNSINKISPDYVVFFASEISMNTIDQRNSLRQMMMYSLKVKTMKLLF